MKASVLVLIVLCNFAEASFFLHVSDIHLDIHSDPVHYLPNTYCQNPSRNMRPQTGVDDYIHRFDSDTLSVPGSFGRYGCDSPYLLVNSTFANMNKIGPQPNFIIMTGDFLAHGTRTTDEYVDEMNIATKLMKLHFPSIPIFPTIGNNDMSSNYDFQCNHKDFQLLYGLWKDWIPYDQSAQFNRTGSYTVLAKEGFRIISFNTNVYNKRNNRSDDCGQFDWMKQALASARAKMEKVYLIGHIPPSIDDYNQSSFWADSFYKTYNDIIKSYSDIIVQTFFGHIHNDALKFIPDNASTTNTVNTAVGMMIIGTAISPVYDNNPAFTLVSYDDLSKEVLDINSYYLDLANANRNGFEEWKLLYTFSKTYEVNKVTLNTAKSVFRSFQSRPELWNKYNDFRTALYNPQRIQMMCMQITQTNSAYQKCITDNQYIS